MSRILLTACLAAFAFTAPAVHAADAAGKKPPFTTREELKAKYGDSVGKIANIKGLEVYYKDEGKGPAILMIHGSSSTLKTYDIIAAKLKDRYRIIRFDIPPLGLSGPVSDEDVKRVDPTEIPKLLLDQLGVTNLAGCVGVSSGGTNCIFLAARHPALVERLILSNNPSSRVEDANPRRSEVLEAEQKKSNALGYKHREYWTAFFSHFAGVPDRITPNIIDQYYDFNRRPPDKNLIALAAKVADNETAMKLMNSVKIPVLLVWGETDPLLGPPAAELLANTYLKNANISKIMLPDVGHYPPLEIPERYSQIIAAYIEAATPNLPKK